MKILQKLSLFSAILLFFPQLTFAQNLQTSLSFMKENVNKLTVREMVVEQSFSGEDCIYTIHVNNTADGKDLAYEFNAADLNEYKVSFKTSKSEVFILAETKGNKNLIRCYENGVVKSYQNDFSFYAGDVELARAIVDNFKTVVIECSKLQENIGFVLGNSKSMQGALSYLTGNIKKVEVNGKALSQTFSYDKAYPSLMKYELINESDGKTSIYELNVSDINHTTVEFNTKGEFVFITGETKGERALIKVFVNGELVNYASRFTIYTDNIEEARRLVEVFKYYVQEGEKVQSKDFTELNNAKSLQDINVFISRHVNNVAIGTENYKQAFVFNPGQAYMVSLKIEDVNAGVSQVYDFNLADLNENAFVFDTRGNKVFIYIKTAGGLNIIALQENGVQGNYQELIKFQANGIEEARYVVEGFKKAVTVSKEKQPETFLAGVAKPTKAQCLAFLNTAIVEVLIGDDAYKQKFDADPENNCLINFEVTNVSKGEVLLYKLNMGDINIHKTLFDTKGREAFVSLETMGAKNLIEIQREGVTLKFYNRLFIKTIGIEEARKIEMALEALIEQCGLD